jgi:hypothetical protein
LIKKPGRAAADKDGRWLIKEKRIYRCNDETPLPSW